MRLLRDILILTCVLLLASCLPACSSIPKAPQLPETITKIVEVYKPVPAWATIELPLPPEADTVREHLVREASLERALRLANCHRALLKNLDAGVKPEDCE